MLFSRTTAACVLMAGLAVAGATPASVSAADGRPDSPGTDRSGPEEPGGDVAYLMNRYGLDRAAAQQSLSRQGVLAERADQMRNELGASFAGIRYLADQGSAVIYTTDLEKGRRMTPPGIPYELRLAQRSDEDLAALTRRAETALLHPVDPNDALGILTFTSAEDNALIVEVSDSATAAARRAVAEFTESETSGSVIVREVESTIKPLACRPITCNPPLRGGVEIHPAGDPQYRTTPWCTSAFNVKSVVDGKIYLLTAAHCQNGVYNSTKWTHEFSLDGISHVIGARWSGAFGGETDAQIISLDNLFGWKPSNTILYTDTRDSNGVILRPGVDNFAITSRYGPNDFGQGITLCKTGARTDTSCGSTTGERTQYSDGGHTAYDQIVTNLCARGGDSGGPIFSESLRRAAGVLVAGNERCDSDGRTLFTKISSAEKSLNVQVLISALTYS